MENAEEKKNLQQGESLNRSVERLNKQSESQESGLSSDFKSKAASQDVSMALIQGAMEKLAGPFVEKLSVFKHSTDPVETMEALEEAEALWQEETQIIQELDAEGSEEQFLLSLRSQYLRILQDQIPFALHQAKHQASPEHQACCLGILSLLDRIYEERGLARDSRERNEVRLLLQTI